MKPALLLLFAILVSCKSQETSDSKNPDMPSIKTYTPNPDEVIFHFKLIESDQTEKGWNNTVEVIRQFKSGFGYKDRLRPGEQVTLHSKEQITAEEFYCAAAYKLAIGNKPTSFVLTSFLKE